MLNWFEKLNCKVIIPLIHLSLGITMIITVLGGLAYLIVGLIAIISPSIMADIIETSPQWASDNRLLLILAYLIGLAFIPVILGITYYLNELIGVITSDSPFSETSLVAIQRLFYSTLAYVILQVIVGLVQVFTRAFTTKLGIDMKLDLSSVSILVILDIIYMIFKRGVALQKDNDQMI